MSSCFDAAPNRFTAATAADDSLGLGPWLSLALALHGAIALVHRAAPKPDAAAGPPLQIDLAPPAPPEPPSAREPAAEAPGPAPKATARLASLAHLRAPAEPRVFARAGKVLTAGDAEETGAPVSFVTDPEGRSYGSGVVAKGAVAERSTEADRSPVNGPAGPQAARGDALTPPSDLSRKPALDGDDPCRGFFPSSADRDDGRVTLDVVVQPSGAVGMVTVLGETPAGEGFGDAARACLAAQKFIPALDRAGRPTRTATRVRIHFTR